MQQLDLFGYVTFGQAYDHQCNLECLRAEYLAGYITSVDKPSNMPWDMWFKHVAYGNAPIKATIGNPINL